MSTHAAAHAASKPGHFNELDPHGAEAGHHSHVIIGTTQLRLVLAVLLFFTALTVGLAQLEVWIADFFDFVFPYWVNIVIAMSIAVVKSLFVLAIFMQLRYDNPINAMIVAFSLLGVGLFIGFTALDLTTRDRIYEFRAGQVVAGGTGGGSGVGNLVEQARERYLEKLTLELGSRQAALAEYQRQYDKKHKGHHGHDEHVGSSPNHSRPKVGLSGALSTQPTSAKNPEGASDAHSEGAPDGHAAPAH